jgi:O-antigen/teichoic acid export membrane protein
MSLVKRNLAANFAANMWMPFLWLLLTPAYVAAMGIEAFGVIGLFLALQAIMVQLDFGLSLTLNRELARLSVQEGRGRQMRDLLRTTEFIYWGLAVAAGIVIVSGAPIIAHHWVKPRALSPLDVQRGLMMMGMALAFQLPLSLYAGGLMGLQRQVLLNGVNMAMYTIRFAGVLPALKYVAPTLQVFFTWQAAAGLAHVAVLGACLRLSLPKASGRSSFNWPLLRSVGRFAVEVWVTTALGMVMTQLDKVILSKTLSLEMFGYYALAGLVVAGFYRLYGSVVAPLYPRLAQLAHAGSEEEIRLLYHRGCQLLSTLAFAALAVVAFFSPEVLYAWTGSAAAAGHTALILSLLAVGTCLNGLMQLPYALQLAHGWTRLGLWINIVAVLVLAPLIYFLAIRFGAPGAAAAWIVLNAGYVSVGIPLMHRRLLRGEMWRWYGRDVALPLAGALLVALPARIWVPLHLPRVELGLALALILCLAAAAAALAASELRKELFSRAMRLVRMTSG